MKKGFTLLELLLSITILTIIVGIGIPVYQSLQNNNNLDIAKTTVVQGLRRAQELSRSGEHDAMWGVKVQSGSITLFKGATYAARDSAFDELFDTPSNIVPTGSTEIVFSKFYGIPNTTGTLTLTLNNTVQTLNINEKGTLTY